MLTLFLALFLQLPINFNPDGVEQRLRSHVEYLTADTLQGRAPGSEGEKLAAEYLYDRLDEYGVNLLSPREGEDFFINDTINGKFTKIHSRNVIGIVEGYDSKLKNEFIVVGAHFDNVGTSHITINGEPLPQLFPGADGNASGVALLLELARQVEAQKFLFRRSVVFAFFGAGEESCAGSWYFLNRSFGQRESIVLMVNLSSVGRSGGENKFQIFTGLHNLLLNAIANDVGKRAASLVPVPSHTDYYPSDHRTFNAANIPITLFTTGYGRDYHTVNDTKERLDYSQMMGICEYVMAYVQTIGEREERIANDMASANSAQEAQAKDGERIYSQWEVDRPAQFLHGGEMQFLQRWVYKYIKYPESALRDGIHGRVIVEFVVGKDGSVGNVKITKGLCEEIDNEVIKVISASPKWKAALHNKKSVRVKISVPVDFKVEHRARFGIKK